MGAIKFLKRYYTYLATWYPVWLHSQDLYLLLSIPFFPAGNSIDIPKHYSIVFLSSIARAWNNFWSSLEQSPKSQDFD